MAFEIYACYVYVGNDRLSFETTDIVEAANWCCETVMDRFYAYRFVCAHCLSIDTENGPTHFPFSFHRNGSTIVEDNHDSWVIDFEDISLNDLINLVLSTTEA